jgi:hypothetical protein
LAELERCRFSTSGQALSSLRLHFLIGLGQLVGKHLGESGLNGERSKLMKKKNIGSSFDGWLREEGIYEEVAATSIKRVLAWQVEAAMKYFSKLRGY